MNTRLLLSALVAALLALPVARAADTKDGHTALESQMEKMNAAWRKLRARGQLDDPAKNAASLESVAVIRAAAAASLDATPSLAEKKPAAERARFVADYRAAMKAFIANLDRFAAALKANNNDEAKRIFAALAQAQREAHQQFQPPRPPRGDRPPAKQG
jgi:soluble cytochrome b562